MRWAKIKDAALFTNKSLMRPGMNLQRTNGVTACYCLVNIMDCEPCFNSICFPAALNVSVTWVFS